MLSSGGWRRTAMQFMEIMQEHGVVTIDGANKIRSGYKIRDARASGWDEDASEDSSEVPGPEISSRPITPRTGYDNI